MTFVYDAYSHREEFLTFYSEVTFLVEKSYSLHFDDSLGLVGESERKKHVSYLELESFIVFVHFHKLTILFEEYEEFMVLHRGSNIQSFFR